MREEIFIRTSERVTFNRCRQKWWWAFIENLKPKQTAPALAFGSLVHDALATYYKPNKPGQPIKRGRKPHLTFKKLYLEQATEFGMRDEETWVNALDMGTAMLKNYVALYGLDERYRIIAPEQTFQIDIHDPETDEYLFTYVGTFDAVIEDLHTRELGLFEHKTARTISLEHLTMDEQAGSYWAFAPDWLRGMGILKPKKNLDFILYNYLRKSAGDERPQNAAGQYLNKDGSVSKSQPAPLFARRLVYRSEEDRRNTMLRVIEQGREMLMVRNGELPHYKNILNGCTGMLGCEFRDMCELHESGSDWQAVRDATMTTWDPYESHEDSREEQE